MSVFIHALALALPPTIYPQAAIRDMMKAQPELDRLGQRLTSMVYNASGIDQRHSAIDEFFRTPDQEAGLFFDPASSRMLSPSTRARNEVYTREAAKLFVQAAQDALSASGVAASDITHVITVSCTGFFAPGPDYAVVRGLGLGADVQRFHVGFMGCYAAFPALKMAKAFCEADPQANVLVICAELCTLHMHSSRDPDAIIANSVFADGAAAALVSAQAPATGRAALELDHFETTLTPVGIGETEMAWTVGDQGFDMVLSTYVPAIIESHIVGALVPLLTHSSASTEPQQPNSEQPQGEPTHGQQVQHWAIHPGGRSILDKVQSSLKLSDAQLRPSREVLRLYGNMSSVTILFILADLLREMSAGERVCAMAFGPGLTVESGLMTRVDGA